MKPHYADEWLSIYEGDCRDVLRELPADSVDCVVTSPPYWGLRDYGVEGQLGLERTPEEYVANMVAVFAEVRRVLKPSGTCWLNLGDSYAGGGRNEGQEGYGDGRANRTRRFGGTPVATLKPKQLVGIPWRVAFALQADGWYLRSDVIWSKPNPMPESVTDRPTKSHEYLFLLTKSARYYFDADAVREPNVSPEQAAHNEKYAKHYDLAVVEAGQNNSRSIHSRGTANGRNIRSVWTIATRPYPGAHFAVFPPELPERCIKAGSSEKGVCPECGAPWERHIERGKPFDPAVFAHRRENNDPIGRQTLRGGPATVEVSNGQEWARWKEANPDKMLGWRPTCAHVVDLYSGVYPMNPKPAVVLDPFGGSGTVGMVANRLSRRAILIDLNPEYLRQQMQRNAQTPLGLDAA